MMPKDSATDDHTHAEMLAALAHVIERTAKRNPILAAKQARLLKLLAARNQAESPKSCDEQDFSVSIAESPESPESPEA